MLVSIILFLSCATEPESMPTEKQISDPIGFSAPDPLYQLLYDSPVLPSPSAQQQRVRALIWLQRMELSRTQLTLLKALRSDVINRQAELIRVETQTAETLINQENEIYNQFWDALKEGKKIEDQTATIAELKKIRASDQRSNEVFALRIESIKSILDAQREFLKTLSADQENTLIDVLFFLRHRLDPIATPNDFYALVGRLYEPGQYAVLTRGGSKEALKEMNIGGLWTDKQELTGKALHESKREVLLYLALLEPGIEEAIDEALRVVSEGEPRPLPE